MSAPAGVVELVERFRPNLDVYKRADYKETRVRIEFVDPFFEALGWDVRNVRGVAAQYKDVVHEDTIKVGRATRAPDYCFRVGGTRKFFLEVKKPSVSIRDDVGPAYQRRRHAWSARLPLSVLTDFEELAAASIPAEKTLYQRQIAATDAQIDALVYKLYGLAAEEIRIVEGEEGVG